MNIDNRTCHICRKTGHLARACPDKNNTNIPNTSKPNNANKRSFEISTHKTDGLVCEACGKIGHMSWDCPKGAARQGNVQIAQDENEYRVTDDHVEVPEAGEALLMRRNLLNPSKELHEPVQRKNLFRTM